MLATRYDDKGHASPTGQWVYWSEYKQAVDVLADVAKLRSDDPTMPFGTSKAQQLARIAMQEICKHEYRKQSVGRCLTNYYCPLCGKSKQIDSGD
jgi:hypothetical protein